MRITVNTFANPDWIAYQEIIGKLNNMGEDFLAEEVVEAKLMRGKKQGFAWGSMSAPPKVGVIF